MGSQIIASFKLYVQCANCRKNSSRRLDVPDEDDAPTTVDELVDSALLNHIPFTCQSCDGRSAKITGVNEIHAAA